VAKLFRLSLAALTFLVFFYSTTLLTSYLLCVDWTPIRILNLVQSMLHLPQPPNQLDLSRIGDTALSLVGEKGSSMELINAGNDLFDPISEQKPLDYSTLYLTRKAAPEVFCGKPIKL
jgi:hypothetical protein